VQTLNRPAPFTSLADVRYKDLNRTMLEVECFESLQRVFTPSKPQNGPKLNCHKHPVFLDEWWVQAYNLAPQNNLVRYVASNSAWPSSTKKNLIYVDARYCQQALLQVDN
jgi:hypothetical protein